jgi:hypothetical protein
MIKILTVLIFILSLSAHAEYRVYQYIVKNKITTSKDQPNSHVVISTLDSVSYIAYHGGRSSIELDLLRTWMCAGDTSYRKEICNSPYGSLPKDVL